MKLLFFAVFLSCNISTETEKKNLEKVERFEKQVMELIKHAELKVPNGKKEDLFKDLTSEVKAIGVSLKKNISSMNSKELEMLKDLNEAQEVWTSEKFKEFQKRVFSLDKQVYAQEKVEEAMRFDKESINSYEKTLELGKHLGEQNSKLYTEQVTAHKYFSMSEGQRKRILEILKNSKIKSYFEEMSFYKRVPNKIMLTVFEAASIKK